MNKIRSVFAILAFCGAPFAGDYAVIVNPSSGVSSISSGELKRIFLGRQKELGATKAVPINLPENDPAAEAFLKEVVGKSAQEYKKHWLDAQIKGEGTAPMEQKSAGAVKAMVSELPGAIGYVHKADVDATVKAIEVK